jgi:GTPase SAR1 family protein
MYCCVCVMFHDNKVLPRAESDTSPSISSVVPTTTKTGNNGNNDCSNTNFNCKVQAEPDEVETLLSKLDNKYIKDEFSGNSAFLGACFCPCFYLGHLDSKVKREETSCSCCVTISPRLSFGKSGCGTCCLTGLLCTLGWPFSPCLTCYLNNRSNNISKIYELNKTKNCCDSPLIWPKTVLQHVLLYEQLEREGRLFYDWTLTTNVQKSMHQERFEMIDTAVLMVGGKGVGKTELLMKLCHRNLYEKREGSFENNEVRVGFRPMTVCSNQVSSLEFWDIPVLHLQSIHTVRAKITYVLLVFDVNRIESFNELKSIYRDVKVMQNIVDNAPQYIIVAAKNDHLYHKTTAEGKWDSDLNQATLSEASTWASQHHMQLLSTATTFNIGVNDILKIVQLPHESATTTEIVRLSDEDEEAN